MNHRTLAGLLLAVLFTLDGARAAEILVNEEVTDGCTLRDAVRAANADAPRGDCPAGNGADTIRIVQFEFAHLGLNNPALPINSTITIESHVPGQRVSIDRNNLQAIPHRVFDITLTAEADQIDTVPGNNIDDTDNGGILLTDALFSDSFEGN